MSDNFLSFVSKVVKSSTDTGAEKSPLAAAVPSQVTDFSKVFAKEAVASTEEVEVKGADQSAPVVAQSAAVEDQMAAQAESIVAPVTLPVIPDNGNPLPKLSIYTPGLQVGRVILTTTNTKVNEDSLTAFARAQGISEAVLKQPQFAEANPVSRSAQVAGLKAETAPSILSGLLSNSALQRNPLEGQQVGAPNDASTGADAGAKVVDGTLSALRAQQAFAVTNSAVKTSEPKLAGGELVNPLATTMMGAQELRVQRQQSSRVEQVTDQGKEFTDKQLDGLGKGIEAKVLSEKLSISELRQARQAIDSVMEIARSNVQNGADVGVSSGLSESTIAATASLSAPPVSGLQGAAPVVAAMPTSLGTLLSANDPSLMQARMQPYQDWAEKFGEVLGQKLSLAVKQGTWAVKLNLNPHSLGEITIALEVGEKGIEGQLSANDGAVRQLLSDALPKLRSSLEDLLGQSGSVNIEVGDDKAGKDKQPADDMLEIVIDLEDEIFNGNKVLADSGTTLRDGFDVLV
jgi:flagellar hook-length control protein FliK